MTQQSRTYSIYRKTILQGMGLCLLALCVGLAAGCNSTNPFTRMQPDYTALPVDDISAMAQRIEQAVAEGDRQATFPDQGAVTVDTPALNQAIRTRAARAELLHSMLEAGYLKEEKNGLVAIQRGESYSELTTRQERDRYAMVVMGENRDRWTLYEGILKANNFAPRNLSAVQALFHQARIPLLPDNANYEPLDPDWQP